MSTFDPDAFEPHAHEPDVFDADAARDPRPPSGEFRSDLRRILADRHSPEAGVLFRKLLEFTERRVQHLARTRCRGLLSQADQEELIGEVLFKLMEGALARFRGETIAELHAYVRTMTDRMATRRAQRRLLERETVADLRDQRDTRWAPETQAAPDDHVDFDAPSPLDEADRAYLTELVQAGSKAELARRANVSRAAVTQRVARIKARIDALAPSQRAVHEAWLQRVATEALDEAAASDGS